MHESPDATPGRVHSLHPDCPDMARLGPDPAQSALRAMAARADVDRTHRAKAWERGFTRRRFVAGAGMVGVAAFGLQTVTTRVSFAAGASPSTLVVIFLRGGSDGLSVLVPAGDPNLLTARPTIAVRNPIALDRGFGLHPALAPLMPLWRSGRLTAVPAVSTPDLSRSHFQAQDCLERGGSASSGSSSGWLDRTLSVLGPGTTFRGIGYGSALPRALIGGQGEIALRSIADFDLQGWEGVHDKTVAALSTLYTGFQNPISGQAATTLTALASAEKITKASYKPSATYPAGDFGTALADIARLVKEGVGLRVANVDLGGWDMHTQLGTVDNGDMKNMLGQLGSALSAFATDLGDKIDDVTVVTMTEFGRRIQENDNRGADHGHGGVVLLMGGGIAGGKIGGAWPGLAPEAQDNGDVAGANDYRDLLGEVLTSRMGLGVNALNTVFPGHKIAPLGVMA